jgi:Response regulator containing CheY-like receiver domain and AraC-type DNA-binding domain
MIRVLIVEDDKLARKGLIHAMPWAAFDMAVVGEANCGQAALDFLAREETDLVLTDFAMPGMTGCELMRAAGEAHPRTAFVVLTFHQELEYAQEAFRLGAIDYVAKIQLEQESFDEVLGRIRDRYESWRLRSGQTAVSHNAQPEDGASFYGPFAAGHDASPPGAEELSAIEAALLSFDWLFDEAAFSALSSRIIAAAPPHARLLRLLFETAGEWNRIFCPIAARRVEAPDSLASWQAAESWLSGLREATAAGNRRLSYAGSVVASVMRAACIVEAELGGQLLAQDVARRVNMSRAYFCRCFKDIAGAPFNDYLQRARVDRAKLLLANTEAQVCQVAEQVGYSDEKYFAKVFREQSGQPPSAYRLAAREGRRSSSAE